MGLTLKKGENLSLTKADPGLRLALLGLGWDARTTSGNDFDLDASALLIGANGKVRSDADFVFYNQAGDVTYDGKNFDPDRASVMYQGDNRTGSGDGDDEQVIVDLSRIPNDIEKVVFTVSIYDFEKRQQTFGQVSNAFIRLVNHENDREIVRYDLTEDYAVETALVFAELYKLNGEWKFKAIGQGWTNGLGAIAREYGVNI